MSEFDKKVQDLAANLYEKYTSVEKGENSEGMGDYLLERAKSLFYGKLIEDIIPDFLKTYETLKTNNITDTNSINYGDLDGDIFMVKTKDEKKVVVMTNNCVCRDDSTLVFIYDKNTIRERFHVRRVWRRQVKHKGWNFGDHRDIEFPSLTSYKKYEFDFGYNDARDKGYVWSYEKHLCSDRSPTVDKPNWSEHEISIGLRDFKYLSMNVRIETES